MQNAIADAVNTDQLDGMFDQDAVERIESYTHNIVSTFARGNDDQIEAGLVWYPNARNEAARVASECDISLDCAAHIIAVLSPSVSWGNQVNYTIPFVKAVQNGASAYGVKAPFYGANKAKAARILDGDFSALSGVKVEAFYRNIMGGTDVATIDRHALRVALGRDASPSECSALLSKKSTARLEVIAAYHLAAARLGYDVASVQAVTWVVFRGKAG
jgi:hypothetical protein